MGPKDVIKQALDTSDFILKSYVSDLADADLRLKPIDGMHPIALQLGHLILAEQMLVDLVKPGAGPKLPDGFKEAHDLKNKELTDEGFLTKDKYLEMLSAQRAVTLAVLVEIPDADLSDTRNGTLPPWASTVGAALLMAGMHSLNHTGQFVAVRRMLKKPIAF
jgi:DinB superfamily